MILATMTVPGLRDTLLLSHLYKLWLEAARRSRTSQEQPMTMNTAGQKFQQAWQSVTKAVKSKAEQEDLWLAFFNVALEEDCWEDVRFVSLSLHIVGLNSPRILTIIRQYFTSTNLLFVTRSSRTSLSYLPLNLQLSRNPQ
jgi:hypothetical protein